jgi:hypothetical protein
MGHRTIRIRVVYRFPGIDFSVHYDKIHACFFFFFNEVSDAACFKDPVHQYRYMGF